MICLENAEDFRLRLTAVERFNLRGFPTGLQIKLPFRLTNPQEAQSLGPGRQHADIGHIKSQKLLIASRI